MINYTPARNLYPTEGGGESLGQMATGDFGPTPGQIEAGTAPDVNAALEIGGQASPLIGLLVFAALAAAIMFAAQRVGDAGAFSNIKASAYNVLFISLVAVAGIPIWKFAFTRVPVPGVSTWVHTV